MKPRVASDLRKSARLFVDVVWPAISPLLGGGDFVSLESENAAGLKFSLDTLAGIDGFQVQRRDNFVRGIATRVQCVKSHDEAYNTFTIRYSRANGAETEWVKRVRAITAEYTPLAYPELTVQAYVHRDTDELISAAIVPTRALYLYALRWQDQEARNRLFTWQNWHDKNQFLVIPWSGLVDDGVPIIRWPYTPIAAPQAEQANV